MTTLAREAAEPASGSRDRLRILCLTSIFPNALQPNKGIYNWKHCRNLSHHADVRVISPIAWPDDWRARRRGLGRLANHRLQSWNGVEVFYPRFLYTPGLLRGTYGTCLKWSLAPLVRSQIAEFQPDIIYGCWAYPDGWAAWKLARQHRLPVAVKVHGSDLLLIDDQPARKRMTSDMLTDLDATSVVSNDLRNCAIRLGAPAERVHLIYEGTDFELFYPGNRQEARQKLGLTSTGKRLLFVGNLLPVKAIHVLIEACSRLLAEGIPFEADLIGEGPLRTQLEQQIAQLGLTEHVRLRGRVLQSAVPDWYRAADLVVLSSVSEGVPNVLVEAAACGTPFVSTDVGGISEIANLSPGPLVPAGDPAALAAAIKEKLLNSEQAASQINRAAIVSTQHCAAETIGLFQQIIASHQAQTTSQSS
ncbi:MAG: glycosyltransferase [Planctomycetes bacterium]|nr:glycosyltransferase [Planctomycetota bacterium]